VLTVGLSLAPARATLGRLGWTLAGLSLLLWVASALAGRWLVRRGLAPMARMASAARAMKATDLHQRLPAPGTGDELADLQQAFNDLLSRLQDAFERQRRFTGDASHQLRTPLAVLLGQIEVALRRDRPAEEYRQVLSLAHAQGLQLRRIVEALLFLARADAESPLEALEVVDLAAWLPGHLAGWAGHPRAADLRPRVAADAPLPVRVQPLLLGQLLDNLLDNAFKYSEPGTPVVVTASRDGDQIALAVEDAGPGIDAADLPHVVEPFYRSARARLAGRGGTGLGLAVAQRIASVFGGRIEAAAEPGRGSRFTVLLPAQPARSQPLAAEPAVARES
jgi:signal transduction histidine kinase